MDERMRFVIRLKDGERVQHQSLKNKKTSTKFNKHLNLVRGQGSTWQPSWKSFNSILVLHQRVDRETS